VVNVGILRNVYEKTKHLIKQILVYFRILQDNKSVEHYYSQDGEDVVLRAFYEGKCDGFYVDIGAHHPLRFSNTQLFYENGWTGLNIDANPKSIKEFNKIRHRDINVEIGVSDASGKMEYYSFTEPALNSFDKTLAQERIDGGWILKEIIKVPVTTINDILNKYLPENKHIDFMTIDVEGLEYRIIQSLDFVKYAPDFFLIEELGYVSEDFMKYRTAKIYALLRQKGYSVVAKTMRTVIFRKTK
jgi:FkbM family methyltransferase